MMPDHSFSRNSSVGGRRRASSLHRKSYGERRARGNGFTAVALTPEAFFLEMTKALRSDGLEELADAFQRKSIFLDLGILNGFTTFIVWIACRDTYQRFTSSQSGLKLATAASKAAKTLGLAKPVRTVIGFYNVKVVTSFR